MIISARLIGASDLARFDAANLGQRLRAELERELQVSLASDRSSDAATRRAALDLALQRLTLRRLG